MDDVSHNIVVGDMGTSIGAIYVGAPSPAKG